jgi:hypothetical protein
VEAQHVFAALIIAFLFGLSAFYTWRQVQTLRVLRLQENLPREDYRYVHNQAWRRLFCCGLTLLLAVLLLGTFVLGLETKAETLKEQRVERQARGEEMNDEEKQFFNLYTYYWITILLVLLILLCTAAFDLYAIRQFGLRHHRQIQADRRAMLERQVARLRTERNGHG